MAQRHKYQEQTEYIRFENESEYIELEGVGNLLLVQNVLMGGGTSILEKPSGGCPLQAEADSRGFVTGLGFLRVALNLQKQVSSINIMSSKIKMGGAWENRGNT